MIHISLSTHTLTEGAPEGLIGRDAVEKPIAGPTLEMKQ